MFFAWLAGCFAYLACGWLTWSLMIALDLETVGGDTFIILYPYLVGLYCFSLAILEILVSTSSKCRRVICSVPARLALAVTFMLLPLCYAMNAYGHMRELSTANAFFSIAADLLPLCAALCGAGLTYRCFSEPYPPT